MSEFRHNAFISYRSASRRAAERLNRDLHALAKRHDSADFDLFLDVADLRPGALDERLRAELEESRCLVVLLDRDTVQSPWVAKEISHWLATVGTPERLFLVRLDDLDLTWEESTGEFTAPLGLPEPLRGLFTEEQKWIDYAPSSFNLEATGLAGLCASLLDVDPAEFLLEEAVYQRRRTRRLVAVLVVIVLLLAASVVGFVVASQAQLEAERSAAEARAQADAAEALLAAADSPTVGIERVLRAASISDSPTVRSAMLAVSQSARRLKRALIYPENETGHPADDVAFTPDGAHLLTWGRGREEKTTYLRLWDLATGRFEHLTAGVSGITAATPAGDGHLAACASEGPVLIELTGGRVTTLDQTWKPDAACSLHRYRDGVVLVSSSAYLIDPKGEVRTIEGVDSAAANPQAPAAAVAGRSGVHLVTATTQRLASDRQAKINRADYAGGFTVQFGPHEWGTLTEVRGSAQIRTRTLPANAVVIAPVLDGSKVTDDFAWLTADGEVRWTRDDRATKLENSQGEPSWTPFASALQPLGYGVFLAVHRNTAALVVPPGGQGPQWTQQVAAERLGSAKRAGAEPVVAACASADAALVHTDLPEGGSVLLRNGQHARRLPALGQFGSNCDVVVTGGALTVVPQTAIREDTVQLRPTLVADKVVVSPVGDQLAVLRAGFPIEVLSTLPTEELPAPWDIGPPRQGLASALGEREVLLDSKQLVLSGGAASAVRISVPDGAKLVAPRPDGTGAVLGFREAPGLEVTDRRRGELSTACATSDVVYRPGKDFQQSTVAAEAQIPFYRKDKRTFVDCRNGSTADIDPDHRILGYEIGRTMGRIVSRIGERTMVTTWTRGDESSLATVEGPAGDGQVTFDPTGTAAVTFTAERRELTVYRREGETWRQQSRLATNLPRIAGAQLVENGTLLLAVATGGGFELFDTATSRVVASQPNLSTGFGLAPVTGFSARSGAERLVVSLHTGNGTTTGAVIRIPIGIAALRRQLCALHKATECGN